VAIASITQPAEAAKRSSPGSEKGSARWDLLAKARALQAVVRAPSTRLTRLEKLLLADLICYAGPDGCAWPSVATLAAHLDVTPRAVQKNLQWLAGAGFIERRIHPGRGHTNEYRVVDLASNLPEAKANPGSGFETEKVNVGSGFDRGKGEPGSPEKVNLGDAKRRTPVHPNKEEEYIRESPAADRVVTLEEPAMPPTDNAAAASSPKKPQEGKGLGDEAGAQQIRDALAELPLARYKPPDEKLVSRLLAEGRRLGAEPAEVAAWIADTVSGNGGIVQSRIRSWGYFLKVVGDDFPAWRRARTSPPAPVGIRGPEENRGETTMTNSESNRERKAPECSLCKDWGCFAEEGKWRRCPECEAGKQLDERILDARNKYAGKREAS